MNRIGPWARPSTFCRANPVTNNNFIVTGRVTFENAAEAMDKINSIPPNVLLDPNSVEGTMLIRVLMAVPMLAFGIVAPAGAQQSSSLHHYMIQFKNGPQSVKALIDNPQDRTAPVHKLMEGFGGKLDSYFFYSTLGEYDGVVMVELPDDLTAQAVAMTIMAAATPGTKLIVTPLITTEEAKQAMEKAKQVKTGYTPPTETK